MPRRRRDHFTTVDDWVELTGAKLAQEVEQGHTGDALWQIDHHFTVGRQRQALAAKLERVGYATTVERIRLHHRVTATKYLVITPARIENVRDQFELFADLAAGHRAAYDGWDGMIVRPATT